MTLALRPVNSATKAENWPMLNNDPELSDVSEIQCFASLDFCVKYLRCPTESESYGSCGMIAQRGAYVSTRVLHALKNAYSYFRSTIPPLFNPRRDTIKGRIDNFIAYAKTGLELMFNLEEFCMIFKLHNMSLS